MDKEIIFLVEEDAEGGYAARSLGCSIFTEAETVDELVVRRPLSLGCCGYRAGFCLI
jgi:hypothetical protein